MCDDKLVASLSRRDWIIASPIYAVIPLYVGNLRSQRYARETIQMYLAALAHFGHWLSQHRVGILDVNDALVAEFVECHLPSCHCRRPCMYRVATIRPALQHLLPVLKQFQGLDDMTQPQTPIGIELDLYKRYLVGICGCAQNTCEARLGLVRRFLSVVFDERPVTFGQLTPENLASFIAQSAKGRKPATLRANCVRLTSYLRFRALQGNDIQALLAAIPHMAPPMPTRLPATMTDAELTTFLTVFDLTNPIGLRDFAIVRCMADLALRRAEVLRLNFESFNWRDGTLRITHNKSGRERKLPLPVQTAEAIIRYLKEGRPETTNRAIFVRHIAPFDDPLGTGAINNMIRCALIRAGFGDRFHGTHLFRRSAATRMVQSGVSLKDIADVLGHRNLNTTKFYTRVDMNRLRAIAQPWPGSPS
jgi:site-specific recombinase XerD